MYSVDVGASFASTEGSENLVEEALAPLIGEGGMLNFRRTGQLLERCSDRCMPVDACSHEIECQGLDIAQSTCLCRNHPRALRLEGQ